MKIKIKNWAAKFFAIFATVIFLPTTIFAINIENSSPQLLFAQNCESRDGCELFPAGADGNLRGNENFKIGQNFQVDIILQNPKTEQINSVSSWVKFNGSFLRAVKISTENSPFNLASPDGDEIDTKNSIVQISRAAMGKSVSDSVIFVASIIFEVVSSDDATVALEFFNFQNNEMGNTGAFRVEGLSTINIVETAPPKLILNLNNAGSLPAVQNPNLNSPTVQTPIATEPQIIETVARPTNLTARAENSQVSLVWDRWDAEWIRGFFVYYSTESGRYIFRVDAGLRNFATVKNLPNSTRHFFAVTAYDSAGRESDFSDEVFATPGVAGSESSLNLVPIAVGGANFVAPGGQIYQTGPENLILFSFLAAIFVTAAGKIFFRNFYLAK